MLAQFVTQLPDAFLLSIGHNATIIVPLFFFLSLTVGTWAVWRLWRFTILPRLRPNEPPYLPYLIPCKMKIL